VEHTLASIIDQTWNDWSLLRFELNKANGLRISIILTLKDQWSSGAVGFDDVTITKGYCDEGNKS